MLRTLAIFAIASCLLLGCNIVWRRVLANPDRDQVIRVESGERIYFDLEENASTGYLWDFVCDDPDVEVTIDHEPGESGAGVVGAPGHADVRLRIHRGYDGPSTIRFRYRRPWEAKPAKEFTISLFRRTGDCAFWE